MAERRLGTRDATALSRRARWLRWGATLTVLVLGLLATAFLADTNEDQQAAQALTAATAEADRRAALIDAELDPMDAFAESLRAFIVTDQDGVEAAELKSFMAGLYAEWGGLRSVAVAPDNRVSAVVPEAGNEAVIGLYYPDNPEQWPGVEQAIRRREPVLIGPVHLVQGGLGFIYRMPVFLSSGQYWGVVSGVAGVESLIGVEGESTGFAVRQAGASQEAILGDAGAFDVESGTATVAALGTQWEVAVPVRAPDGSTASDIRIVGTVASLALAIAVFLLLGALGREHSLARLMANLSAQAPGVLFQLRQRRDGSRTMTYASAGVAPLLEGRAEDPQSEMSFLESLVHPDDRDAVEEAIAASASSMRPWHQRFRVGLPNQPVTWLLADARPTLEGSEVVWHGWVGDVTEDLRDEMAIRVSASLFEVTRDGVAILDADGIVTEVNPGMESISGYPPNEVVGTTFAEHCQGLTPDAVFEDMWQQLERHGYWRGEVTGRRKDGTARTDSAVVTAVRDPAGRLSHYVVVLDNMNLARDDSVTGLPSARLLDERVRQALEEARTTGTHMVLLVIGLDQFRRINDTYGHRIGDRLLSAVALRLTYTLPTAAAIVRLRGDEFAVVLPNLVDLGEADTIARAALASLASPFSLAGRTVRITASAGLSVFPEDAADVSELHVHANQAMRAAKASGPGEYRFFNSEMLSALQEQARLAEDLQTAFTTDQLSLVYQPIVDLRTGAIHRAESLMRWAHPDLGDIPPDRFIPLAERTGLIGDIGDIVFAAATRALDTLRGLDPEFGLTVNVSPIELRGSHDRHAERLHRLVEAGHPPSALVVEITEGLLLSDDPGVHANLSVYRDGGMRFAIDDFGTGYSSLAYLQRLDVSVLKIDRAFVDGLTPDSDALSLCEAIIEMAHKMNIKVVAEGVETREQNDLLTVAGCDYAQGYFHSRPLPLDDLVLLLKARIARA